MTYSALIAALADPWLGVASSIVFFLLGGGLSFVIARWQLRKQLRRFDWNIIEKGCSELASGLRAFAPDLIITTSGAPSVITGLIMEEARQFVPVYVLPVGAADVAGSPADPQQYRTGQYEIIEHSWGTWYVSKQLLATIRSSPNTKVAIIDNSCTGHGVFLRTLLTSLRRPVLIANQL